MTVSPTVGITLMTRRAVRRRAAAQHPVRALIAVVFAFGILGLAAPSSFADPVNPLWSAVEARSFRLADGRDKQVVMATPARTTDDGIVLLRLYIPSRTIFGAGKGDNRGPTSDPAASSRAWLAWDTRTGRVGFTTAHSTAYVYPTEKPALPLVRVSRDTVWQGADWPAGMSKFWAGAAPGRLDVRLSLRNSIVSAPSIDNDLTISRATGGGYRLQINGNGFPAVEMYYYPHYGPRAVHTYARRSVQPGFMPGTALLDRVSWADCRQESARVLFCDSLRQGAPDWRTSW